VPGRKTFAIKRSPLLGHMTGEGFLSQKDAFAKRILGMEGLGPQPGSQDQWLARALMPLRNIAYNSTGHAAAQ
jgi:hypothetical protein